MTTKPVNVFAKLSLPPNVSKEALPSSLKNILESMGFSVEKLTINNIGRKSDNTIVPIVLNAYTRLPSVYAVAKELGISRGRVWWILKRNAVEIRNAKRKQ